MASRPALSLALLVLATPAHADVELSLRSRLGGGYNSSIYLDAASLPAEGEEVAAPVLLFAPAIEVVLGRAHRLAVSWSGQWHELVDRRESMLDHQAMVGYTTPPLAGLRLSLIGAMHQLYVREAEGMGWTGGWGALQLSRPLGYAVRASLGYLIDYDRYASGAAAEWELAHRVSAALTVRLAPGLTASPGYTFSFVQARPEDLASLQHLGSLRLRWDMPWIPLELGAGYSLTVLLLDGSTSATPGSGRSSRRSDQLHNVRAEAVVMLTRWLGLYALYDGIYGFSNQEPERYTRHQAVGGLLLRWAMKTGERKQRRLTERRVRLRLRAPHARRVAVVGDFNGWDPGQNPLRRHGEVWRTDLQLGPGRHQIMLWVDGALRPPEDCVSLIPDGYGGATCVVTVDR